MPTYSGLYNTVYNETYALLVDKWPMRKRINTLFRKSRTGARELHAILDATFGVASSVSVSDSYSRVQATSNPGEPVTNGGARTIESRSIINRNTTAADIATLDAIVTETSKPTYPIDKSGNGGGNNLNKTFSVG